MTDEENIDYEDLAQGAMRSIVRTVMIGIAKSGRLPGEHHFYIAFDTSAPGVSLSRRLKEKYPDEMTVVLQHRFWDLTVAEDHFAVKLTFDGIPERLVVPFAAIKVFFDPSVPYGLQFEASDLTGGPDHEAGERAQPVPRAVPSPAQKGDAPADAAATAAARLEKKPRTVRKPRLEKGESAPDHASQPASQRAAKPAADRPAEPGTKPAAQRTPARPQLVASQVDKPPSAANDAKVVQLDKFRKK